MMPGHDVLWNAYTTDNVVCECRNVINNVLLNVLLLCHIARASQFMTELSVLVQGMASMMPIFFKTKMQIDVFNLHMGMFDVVLEFSYKCYPFLHSLYNLTNLNMFQETIWHQQGSMS